MTWYPVINAPPVEAGGAKLTVAIVSPAVATEESGAEGNKGFTVNERCCEAAGSVTASPA